MKLKNFCESKNQLRYLGLVLITTVVLINMNSYDGAESGAEGLMEQGFEKLEVDKVEHKSLCRGKHFLSENAPMDKFIAIASYPGSGNTYTRMLLEKATGIYTGSVYHDLDLEKVLKGEGKVARTVFVKTHYPCKYCFSKGHTFSHFIPTEYTGDLLKVIRREGLADVDSKLASILVIRNPFRAFLAEFQRRTLKNNALDGSNKSHTGSIDWESEFLKPNFQKDFSSYFKMYINGWLAHAEYYTSFKTEKADYFRDERGNPVFKVLFEDLAQKDKVEVSLQDILSFTSQFLGEHNIILKDFNNNLSCQPAKGDEGVDTYRRHKKYFNLQVFTERQVNFACRKISDIWEPRWGDCKMAHREVLV